MKPRPVSPGGRSPCARSLTQGPRPPRHCPRRPGALLFTYEDTKVPPRRRLYTVSLPPEGYVPTPPEPQGSPPSEDTSSSDDAGGGCQLSDEKLHDQPKRRRGRKHKSRKSFKNPNNDHAEQAEFEKRQSLLQEKLQPRPTDGPTISKNRKRKLKKKEQMKRKKAAGLRTTASGSNFMYQPEEGDSEQGGLRESDREDAEDRGEDGADARGEDATDACREHSTDANEEDVKSTNEKADGVLNFLKSTQEIYFYDGASKDADSAVSMEASQELFQHLEDHSMSPSDVLLVDHMKTLLLMRDTKSLQHALERFPACCTMPPDHARVLSAFFNYWIRHILPEKQQE
ncbi:glutamate-rich protein 1 isoform X2 [Ailuropoda melanoleuca]|uniref:glutamate-rich protein 1 isoform X2 n=1 Tax=Ailuropoda melanoleuca TaxID=9646 RepID=UPI000948275C|nr:glutamate-rich protein 1 isoform X2 [Ailuropoda melanoleuca]XP_019665194.1 glutamate-rich protein 1 isoform X2 [Ailuropoda melanoleuca]